MSEGHARLSPSSSHRWMRCPGSVRLAERIEGDPSSESFYAQEGTMAHLVAAIEAGFNFGHFDRKEYLRQLKHWRVDAKAAGFDTDRMEECAVQYADYLLELADSLDAPYTLMLEKQVQTGVPGCWGTADAILVTPGLLHVIDYKYGMGIPVVAENNSQLRLYTIGALDAFDSLSEFKDVWMSIFQPRLDSISSARMSVRELRSWRDREVAPIAALALGQDAYLSPSEAACRFCPVAGDCRARAEYMTKRDFGDPDLLSPAELGQMVAQADEIESWCKSVRETALHRAYNEGITIPGWKVVRAAGRRTITDANEAIQVLLAHGYDEEKVTKVTTRTLAELERVVGGKVALAETLGPLLVTPEGKASLVPDTDDRPGIDADAEAAKDFSS